MAKNASRRVAREQLATELNHASNVSAAETDAAALAAATPKGAAEPAAPEPAPPASERMVIDLGTLTEMMRSLPNPADVLGVERNDELKDRAKRVWTATLALGDGQPPAYEYQGRTILRPVGQLLKSHSRTALSQAYYSLRTAIREHRRFQMLDQMGQEARQTSHQPSRPGTEVEGVTDAPWLDGDDRFDPAKAQATRVERAMEEATTYLALAYTFIPKTMRLTDGEPITATVKRPEVAKASDAKPAQTMADRLRAAGGWVGEHAEKVLGPAEPVGTPELQDEPAVAA